MDSPSLLVVMADLGLSPPWKMVALRSFMSKPINPFFRPVMKDTDKSEIATRNTKEKDTYPIRRNCYSR